MPASKDETPRPRPAHAQRKAGGRRGAIAPASSATTPPADAPTTKTARKGARGSKAPASRAGSRSRSTPPTQLALELGDPVVLPPPATSLARRSEPPNEALPDEAEVDAIIRESERAIKEQPAGVSSSFAAYLHDLHRYPVLTPEAEYRLAVQAQRGSEEAKDALIRHNLRFVITIARKHAAHGVGIEDLVQEGNLGLMRAVQKFDPSRGVRFVSYAVWWIGQSVRAALASGQRAMRLPINRATQLARINRVVHELTRTLGRAPSHDEIATVSRVPLDMVKTLLSVAQTELSLDAPRPGDEDSGMPLAERIGSKESLDRQLERKARAEAVTQALQHLRTRDEQILRRCFGLDGGREYTLEEIGLMFNITRERVRQIRDRVIKDLRAKGRADLLRDFWGVDLGDDA